MTRVYALPAAVQWHEGMLLAPQHFQQQDRRHEALLHRHLALAMPFHWGVSHLQYDHSLLLAGTLRLLELEAILPDGLIVSHRAGQGRELQLALTGLKGVDWQHQVRLYIAVASEQRGGTYPSRYIPIESEPLVDESTGVMPLCIPQLQPRLELFAGLPPAGYCALPLVEVRRDCESFFVEDYLPPLLAVPFDSALGERCDRLSLRIRQKAATLMESIRARAAEPQQVAESRQQLRSLVAGLPSFEAVLRSGGPHPFILYHALCELAGHLATLGEERIPPAFSAYEHQDLRRSFEAVFSFLESTLERGVSETYSRIPLQPEAGGFSTRFLPSWMGRELLLEVRGRPGATRQQVLGWMASCRIGSDARHRLMRETRTLGARRELIDGRPGLVPQPHTLLFSLESNTPFIRLDERLLLENTLEPGEVQAASDITLLVRKEN
ncbi:type VI secretion system baseplate subunit TssK [Archangium lansingense]|uniref:Type VI secretion system baseplate subunit TssK n=1 Tax=Archangium lansingense TaxID=2995310 RepID=A0ABT4AGK0_9BACT|nr:type VI secretion system baseplate subunit TssK [Archangium lansinium]MCY1080019.1 type VI secretion system baseplate subunit TssK [Archangium lansinium]